MTGGVGTDFDTEGVEAVASGSASSDVLSRSNPEAVPIIAGRLTDLSVHDLALIDRVKIAFEPGLNVLTGRPAPARACSSTPWAWPSERGRIPLWFGTVRIRREWRRSSIACPSR